MGTLFAALNTASNSMNTLEEAIGVVQNNVTNASTPGYVTQTLNLTANPFNANDNLWGGVEASGVQSARDVYAEQAVWSANQQAGLATQQTNSLSSLQDYFDVSGSTGIPAALSSLYSAFSAWSSDPTDATDRQQVINAATNLSQTFNGTSQSVQQLRSQAGQQLSTTVGQINQYTAQIAQINDEIRHGGSNNSGLQTQLYNTLEELSNVAPISVQTESDGTATVLLGGQSPLVIGTTQNALQLSYPSSANPTYPGGTPNAVLLNAQGQDVTSLADQGTLGGLLQFRNTTLPAVIGSDQQQGSLNQLAQGVADRVNTILASGDVSSGPPAVAGIPLFSYASASATAVAGTLSLNSSISSSQLAAIAPGPPVVANGTAAQLAGLATPASAADMINGLSYTDFYSNIAAGIGNLESAASANETAQTDLLAQAQNMRAQVSGVSLDAQATNLLQFQDSYQAAAQLISTVNTMTQSLLTTMQDLH